ncbi:MAG: glycosyltransferase family 1 protein [Firmicutes bacterium HGW-Firmicutes-5]|jgi:glycosyltransferase involved in cell wall biosynthesis|nr:MAG: glycosyltransferase family 1 protein [Firmicutes bacterium HGW-Firmicutes-5]
MKRALMMASVASMISAFNRDNIKILQNLGYQVDIACNFEHGNDSSRERGIAYRNEVEAQGIKTYQLPVSRSITEIKDIIISYRFMKKICEENHYDIVHCHSPIGGVIARLACRGERKNGTKVVYTAHGFHFYKGAPKKNWLVYYSIEKWVSRFTDLLITINKEDYERAQTFKAKRVVYIPGIGVDTGKFRNVEINRTQKRTELKISEDVVVLLSIGELIERKNHKTALKAVSNLNSSNYVYLICGEGKLDSYLKDLTEKLGIENKVRFLGYRRDIPEICVAADIFIFPSYQEGLPVAVMEAMSAGLPIICSSIRGNTDLIKSELGGFLNQPEDTMGLAQSIDRLINNHELRKKMGDVNSNEAFKYDKKNVNAIMEELYASLA